MTRIGLRIGDAGLVVALTEENPRTAAELAAAVPFASKANRWGDEVYFSVPMEAGDESPRLDVEVGEVAYWAAGRALAVFFGPTPASVNGRPRPIVPVNVIGKVEGDVTVLREILDGATVEVLPAPP